MGNQPNIMLDQIHQQVCKELEAHCGDLVVAHLVHPDPRLGRVPWIEIRAATLFPIELEEQFGQRWPNTDFEVVDTDEDGL